LTNCWRNSRTNYRRNAGRRRPWRNTWTSWRLFSRRKNEVAQLAKRLDRSQLVPRLPAHGKQIIATRIPMCLRAEPQAQKEAAIEFRMIQLVPALIVSERRIRIVQTVSNAQHLA